MPKASQSRRRKNGQNRPANQNQPEVSTSAATAPQSRYRPREMSPRTRIVSLAIGDILCFLIFASIGSNFHNAQGVSFLYSIWIALPFIAAWFLIAPLLGAFRDDVATNQSKMIFRTMICWLATWPVAMFFRWLQIDRLDPTFTFNKLLSFSAVALAVNFVLLIIWRWPFTLNNSLRKRGV